MASKLIPTVILRLYNVFGKGMNNNSGSIINLFLKNKEIEVYGNGQVTRDFIHARDVVSIMKDSLKPKWDGQTVDVGTGRFISIGNLAKIFAEFRGLKVKYLRNKKQLSWPTANTEKLRELYRKELKTNIREDIRKLCQN